MGINVATCHEGPQNAFAYVGLHLGDGGIVNLRRMKTDRLCVARLRRLSILQRLKHPVDDANVEVHICVQAGAKPVDESDQVVMPAVVAPYPRKAMGKDAAFEIFAKRPFYAYTGGV